MSRVTSFVRDRELPNNVRDQRLRVHTKSMCPCHLQGAHLRQVLRYCPEELPVRTWRCASKGVLAAVTPLRWPLPLACPALPRRARLFGQPPKPQLRESPAETTGICFCFA